MIIMHHRLVLQTFLEKTNMEKIYKIWGMGGRRGLERNQTPLLIAGLQFLVYNIFSGLERGKFYENNQELK